MLEGFGKRLKEERQKANLSADELAEKMNVSPGTIRAYERIADENSKPKPPLDMLVKIGEVLDVSLDYLCNGADKEITIRLSECPINTEPLKEIIAQIEKYNQKDLHEDIDVYRLIISHEINKLQKKTATRAVRKQK